MTKERHRLPDEAPQDRKKDLDWIEENRDVFWLTSTVACEQVGRGALFVDTTEELAEEGHPFSYLTEGGIEREDETLDRLLQQYDPHREFVVVLLKPGGRVSTYLGTAPLLGWFNSMHTKTSHLDTQPGK